jgi:hypothetical protein
MRISLGCDKSRPCSVGVNYSAADNPANEFSDLSSRRSSTTLLFGRGYVSSSTFEVQPLLWTRPLPSKPDSGTDLAVHALIHLLCRDIFTGLGSRHVALWIAKAKPIVAISIKDASQAISRQFKSVADFFSRTHRRPLEDSSLPRNLTPLSTQNVPEPDPPD